MDDLNEFTDKYFSNNNYNHIENKFTLNSSKTIKSRDILKSPDSSENLKLKNISNKSHMLLNTPISPGIPSEATPQNKNMKMDICNIL